MPRITAIKILLKKKLEYIPRLWLFTQRIFKQIFLLCNTFMKQSPETTLFSTIFRGEIGKMMPYIVVVYECENIPGWLVDRIIKSQEGGQ